MLLDQIIGESLKLPDISQEIIPAGQQLCFRQGQRESRVSFFPLFPGIYALFIRAQTDSWPIPDAIWKNTGHRILLFCYCISGRNKICLNDRDAISIGSGELVITSHFPENEYIYPFGKCEGISILVDLEELSPRQDYFRRDFGIDLTAIGEKYFSQNTFFTVPSMHEYKETMRILWELFSGDSGFAPEQMKLCVLSVLLIAARIPSIPVSQRDCYLTPGQIRIAENVHAIISADLGRRYSAHELAQKFGTSETSLKNYFKNVYGISFAAYQREARMQKSSDLLKNSQLSVAQIAGAVGYASQSKFANVFREQFGVTPLEYRRLCGISPDPPKKA